MSVPEPSLRLAVFGLALVAGCASEPPEVAASRLAVGAVSEVPSDAVLSCTADADGGAYDLECWPSEAQVGVGVPLVAAVLQGTGDPPDDDDDVCYAAGREDSLEVIGLSFEIVSPRDALGGLVEPCAEPQPSPPPVGSDAAGTGAYVYFLTDYNYGG
ncbi:MAG: hypothetical protein AAF721_38160 [Myxococcota bacterium]